MRDDQIVGSMLEKVEERLVALDRAVEREGHESWDRVVMQVWISAIYRERSPRIVISEDNPWGWR